MGWRCPCVAVQILLAALVLSLGPASSAEAQGFADLFFGGALTQHADLTLTPQGVGRVTIEDQAFETAPALGGRGGWWLGPVGIALDVLWYSPDPGSRRLSLEDPEGLRTGLPFTYVARADVDVVALGLDAMFRGRFLQGSDFPAGRLQPYVVAGPTLFVSTLRVRRTLTLPGAGAGELPGEAPPGECPSGECPETGAVPVSGGGEETLTARGSDTDVRLGLTVGAGVTYLFTRMVGLFAEYRFTHHRPHWRIHGDRFETDLSTHHLLAGVTFRF